MGYRLLIMNLTLKLMTSKSCIRENRYVTKISNNVRLTSHLKQTDLVGSFLKLSMFFEPAKNIYVNSSKLPTPQFMEMLLHQ